MKLEKQLQLLEQCGDPSTMDRMVDVFKLLILEADNKRDMIEVVVGAINTLQKSTDKAYSRMTKDLLLDIR